MLAGCYMGNRTLAVLGREACPPGRGCVELDVAYTGICGTDLHIFHGTMDKRVAVPAVLGHEMSGTVFAVGEDVSDWVVGDHAVVMPLDWCGECPACRAGNSHICHNLNFLGIDSPGSLQSRWTVPARVLVKLPPNLSLETAALAEPTAVAVHDVRRAGLVSGEQTLVVGGGPIGLLVASVARAVGGDVVILELSAGRRAVAESLGLRAVDPTDSDIRALVDDWTEGAGVAVCFEVSGSAAGLGVGISALAVRGRLVVVAIHSTPTPVDLHRVFWRELTLFGARVYERVDFEEAVRLLSIGEVPASQLVTRVVPLTEMASAFELLEGGKAMKILIDCGGGG